MRTSNANGCESPLPVRRLFGSRSSTSTTAHPLSPAPHQSKHSSSTNLKAQFSISRHEQPCFQEQYNANNANLVGSPVYGNNVKFVPSPARVNNANLMGRSMYANNVNMARSPAHSNRANYVGSPVCVNNVKFVPSPARVNNANVMGHPTYANNVNMARSPAHSNRANLVGSPVYNNNVNLARPSANARNANLGRSSANANNVHLAGSPAGTDRFCSPFRMRCYQRCLNDDTSDKDFRAMSSVFPSSPIIPDKSSSTHNQVKRQQLSRFRRPSANFRLSPTMARDKLPRTPPVVHEIETIRLRPTPRSPCTRDDNNGVPLRTDTSVHSVYHSTLIGSPSVIRPDGDHGNQPGGPSVTSSPIRRGNQSPFNFSALSTPPSLFPQIHFRRHPPDHDTSPNVPIVRRAEMLQANPPVLHRPPMNLGDAQTPTTITTPMSNAQSADLSSGTAPAFYLPQANASTPAFYLPRANATTPAFYLPRANASTPAFYLPRANAITPEFYIPRANAITPALQTKTTDTNGRIQTKTTGTNGRIQTKTTDTNGRIQTKTTDTNGRIQTKTTDTNGRIQTKTTDTNGRIQTKTTGTNGRIQTKTTDTNGRIASPPQAVQQLHSPAAFANLCRQHSARVGTAHDSTPSAPQTRFMGSSIWQSSPQAQHYFQQRPHVRWRRFPANSYNMDMQSQYVGTYENQLELLVVRGENLR